MRKVQLPEELVQALLSEPGPVCSCLIVNDLATVIVKTHKWDIDSFRGPVGIAYHYELGLYPQGAGIRLYLEIRDRPDEPYRLETFLNPGSEADLQLLHQLSHQDVLIIHLFDMRVDYQYSKQIQYRRRQRRELSSLVAMATEHLDGLPASSLDWAAVKSQFIEDRPL